MNEFHEDETTAAATTKDDETVTLVSGGLDAATEALIAAGFEEAVAEDVATTATGLTDFLTEMMANVNLDALPQRIAVKHDMLDNTGSMARLMAALLKTFDASLDMVQKITAVEPVEVLSGATWLNPMPGNEHGVVFPFTPIAEAPRFNGRQVQIGGMTPWFDRYYAHLTAFIALLEYLEGHGKTVYGMMGLYCDGFDNDSKQQTPETLAKLIRQIRRVKTHVPYAVYVGALPERHHPDYARTYRIAKMMLDEVGGDIDPELDATNLKVVIKQIFVTCGFDQAMVFLPGDDIRQIMEVFVTVSRMFKAVSVGQAPAGLTIEDL